MKLNSLPIITALAVATTALAITQRQQAPTLDPTIAPAIQALAASEPGPLDWFEIVEGTPYTVPPENVLVVRAIGAERFGSNVELHVDGARRLEIDRLGYGATSMREIPRYLSAPAGSVVEVVDPFSNVEARAWGYLVNK